MNRTNANNSTTASTLGNGDELFIVPYSESLKPGLIRLFRSVPFKGAVWDWEFSANPYSDKFCPVVLCDRNGAVVGFNGVLPVRVRYEGKDVDALWSCDFMVEKELRGRGCGRLMKNRLKETGSLIMVFGVSETAALVLSKMGWVRNEEVRVFQKSKEFGSPKAIAGRMLQMGNYALGTLRRRSLSRYTVTYSELLPGFEEIDRLWSSVAKGYCKVVERNHAYLSWKYEQHPLAKYRFLCLHEGPRLCAVGVYRENGGAARFVDYIGPAQNAILKAALVGAFCDATKNATRASCTTNDVELSTALLAYGFRRGRTRPGFFVWTSQGDPRSHLGWFIMGGDSDGDMLAASRENWVPEITTTGTLRTVAKPGDNEAGVTVAVERHASNASAAVALAAQRKNAVLAVRHLSAHDFANMCGAWSELVSRSNADPLFMGWHWLHGWWSTWGDERARDLCLLGAYGQDGSLLGLAPLYHDVVAWHGWMPIRQLQWVGNSWRTGATVRTEYIDFVAAQDHHSEVVQAFMNHIFANKRWDEFIFRDICTSSETWPLLTTENLPSSNCLVRCASSDPGLWIPTEGCYSDYIKTLGKHTRLRLHNRRKRLETMGSVKLWFASENSVDYFFEVLNRLHRVRWERDCFSGASLKFHKNLARAMVATNQLRASILLLNGEPISALYDLVAGYREYNIQGGFNDKIRQGLSLGMLHLGYILERAFEDDSIEAFDLLAGLGKNTFYKGHFVGTSTTFNTVQLIRSRHMKIAYTINDRKYFR